MIERSFSSKSLDEATRRTLEEFKKEGKISEFLMQGELFVIKRQKVSGQTQDKYFRKMSSAERLGYSGSLFRYVSGKVMESKYGHGALHPRNILLGDDGPNLVDEVFNRVRFDPLAVARDDPWLWGPCVPKGWSMEDWDLVSLLRTAAFLALGPSDWNKPTTREDALEVCRKWALELEDGRPQGADFLPRLKAAVALLPAIVEAEFELPQFPLEHEIKAILADRGKDRVVRLQDEEELAIRAVKFGLEGDALTQSLRVWMLFHAYQREVDLRALAEEFISSGLFGEKLVTARTCAVAERTFTHYGVAPERASELVRELLIQARLVDERQEAMKCRSFLDSNLESTPTSSDDSSINDLAEGFAQESGLPSDIARRLVDLEIERRVLGLAP